MGSLRDAREDSETRESRREDGLHYIVQRLHLWRIA